MMGSRLRRRLFDPIKTLQGADIQPGQTVLERTGSADAR
jgi:hypothetical protein